MNVNDRLKKAEKDIKDLNSRLLALTAAGGYHNFLSSIHQDTLGAAPVAGDIVIADGTPVRWQRKAAGIDGHYLKLVGGIPDWQPVVSAVGEEDVAFYDTFADGSLYWPWTLKNNVPPNRTITEAGAAVTIAIVGATQGIFSSSGSSCPRMSIGPPGYPLIFWGKLNAWTGNDDTQAGVYITIWDINSTTLYTFLYGRMRDDGAAQNGLAVYRANTADPGTQLSYAAVLNLPIWLKIYVGLTERIGTAQLFFDYSTDGLAWTNQYQYTTTWAQTEQTHGIGLFARNFDASRNAISADFTGFKAWRSFGPG